MIDIYHAYEARCTVLRGADHGYIHFNSGSPLLRSYLLVL